MIKNKYLISGIVLSLLFSISLAIPIESQTITPAEDKHLIGYPSFGYLDFRVFILESEVDLLQERQDDFESRLLVNEMNLEDEIFLEYGAELMHAYGLVQQGYGLEIDVRLGLMTLPQMMDIGRSNLELKLTTYTPGSPDYILTIDHLILFEDFIATIPDRLW